MNAPSQRYKYYGNMSIQDMDLRGGRLPAFPSLPFQICKETPNSATSEACRFRPSQGHELGEAFKFPVY